MDIAFAHSHTYGPTIQWPLELNILYEAFHTSYSRPSTQELEIPRAGFPIVTMAEQILDQIRDVAEGQIDFEGQKLVETLSTVLLSIVGIISFLVGYFLQDIKLAVYIGLGGTALTFLAIIPPWPFYNQSPVRWLPIGGGAAAFSVPQDLVIDEKAVR